MLLCAIVVATDAGAVAPRVPPGCGTPIVTSHSNLTPTVIPTGPTTVTSTIEVAGAGSRLTDLDLFLNIQHAWGADLDIALMSPAGTAATITTDNAARAGTFAGTTFDDQADPDGQVAYVTNLGIVTDHLYENAVATPLVSEEALAAFAGENPNGVWTLAISDARL